MHKMLIDKLVLISHEASYASLALLMNLCLHRKIEKLNTGFQLTMTGFEPQISGIGNYRFAN